MKHTHAHTGSLRDKGPEEFTISGGFATDVAPFPFNCILTLG